MDRLLRNLESQNLRFLMFRQRDVDKFCCICDTAVISREFEKLALANVQDDSVLLLLVRGNNVMSMSVVTVYPNYLTIELLCRNAKVTEARMTQPLLDIIKQWAKDNDKLYIDLRVASRRDGSPNRKAENFYAYNGFIKQPHPQWTNYYRLDL